MKNGNNFDIDEYNDGDSVTDINYSSEEGSIVSDDDSMIHENELKGEQKDQVYNSNQSKSNALEIFTKNFYVEPGQTNNIEQTSNDSKFPALNVKKGKLPELKQGR